MTVAATETAWRVKGDYFENCNCKLVCPCLFSAGPPMTAEPTEGACEVAFAFHIDEGSHGEADLADLNVALVGRTPGPMADGNWSVGLYIDDRASEEQRAALQAIFTGSAGGVLANLAPLFGEVLGVKSAPIRWEKEGKRRSVEIPGVMKLAVSAIPNINPDEEIWATNAHPFAPAGVAMAVGEPGSTWEDYGMRWDNSGKNGHYAPIDWSNG
jgi:hypothetical protein